MLIATGAKLQVVSSIRKFFCRQGGADSKSANLGYAESRNGAVTHASCWAHARREFEKAKDSEPRLAAEALDLIGALQLCEREIRKRKLEGAGKLEFRRTHARPVANAFWK